MPTRTPAEVERRRRFRSSRGQRRRFHSLPWAISNTASSGGSGGSGGTLTGLSAVEYVFHFLDGPAEVLRASTASRRWRALACADSVWRARFRREKLLEKARLFEVALPPVPGGQGGAATAAAVVVRDEAAGVGLAFYARVFALKVARQ